MSDHKLLHLFKELGLYMGKDDLEVIHPRVRDREDIEVLRCKKSGVIVLSKVDQGEVGYYEKRDGYGHLAGVGELGQIPRKDLGKLKYNFQKRRLDLIWPYLKQKHWCDFGAGSGGLIDLVNEKNTFLLMDGPTKISAIEPCETSRNALLKDNIHTVSSVSELKEKYDLFTLMHVLEHLTEPDKILKEIHSKLNDGGKVIIEVPHAYDILLDTFDLHEFKDFTYWSEHLALYTRDALKRLLEYCGFSKVTLHGIQRHGVGNHMYWLRHGKPGGHNIWRFLEGEALNKEYEETLIKFDKTDTIIAIADK